MKIVAISDTHGKEAQLVVPDGDVLIHCGDFSKFGVIQLEGFLAWLAGLPHKLVLLTGGNHERFLEREPERYIAAIEGSRSGVRVLLHEAMGYDGVEFFGSPWQPWWQSWAFNLQRGPALAAKWAGVPDDIDVLFTHSPPHGILDLADSESVGCEELRKRVEQIQPKLHIFGHIHAQGGQTVEHQGTVFANVAACDDRYQVVNQPQVFEL